MEKIERLLAKVSMPEGCWVWTGAKGRGGYGRIRTGSRDNSQVELAHRAMWEAIHGPLIQADVLHRCDNPPCVRPDHLYIGTPADNARDRDVRGRNTKAKLTDEKVRLARAAYAAGWSNARLAREFGVTDATMHAIVKGRAWRHVT